MGMAVAADECDRAKRSVTGDRPKDTAQSAIAFSFLTAFTNYRQHRRYLHHRQPRYYY